MPHALVFDLHAPRELYDALHAEFLRYPAAEMVLHVARPVPGGVQIVEVWPSEDALQAWMGAHAGPAMAAVAEAEWTLPEVVGLVVPAAGIAA